MTVVWHEGTAEALPLLDESVDGVVSTLACHHFTSLADAAGEMHRVSPSGPIVLFTVEPREGEPLWFADDFPEIGGATSRSSRRIPELRSCWC